MMTQVFHRICEQRAQAQVLKLLEHVDFKAVFQTKMSAFFDQIKVIDNNI